MTKNARITTNEVPWKIPRKTGNGLSKNRLWMAVTSPEMIIAPMMLVSSVLIPAIIASPLPAVGSAEKSTPKK